MAKVGWYNDNRNRAFPFLKGTVADKSAAAGSIESLPNPTVVDAGFMMGLHAGFDETEHSIWLQRVYRTGGTFFFEFRSDAPGVYGEPLVFARPVSGWDEYDTEHVDNFNPATGFSESSDSLFSLSETCEPEPLWGGYLVTGRLDELALLLPGDGELVRAADGGGAVEPALVQNLARSYVDTINLANDDRTRVDAPDGCPPVEWSHPVGDGVIFVNDRCLRGDVRFKPGFNSTVRQEDGANQLILGAGVGAGEGQPCDDQVPLFDGEVPPDGSALLEGGPRCNEVVRSINGVGGQFGSLLSGAGVRIIEVPEDHRIVVDVDMNRLAVCFSESGISEVSETL